MTTSLESRVGVALVVFTAAVLWTGRASAQTKPLAEADVVRLLELGIEEQAIVGRIEKSGTAFAADAEAIGRLEAAGASEAVIEAVKKGTTSKPTPGGAPVTYQDVLQLVTLGIGEDAILSRLEKSPTAFTLDAEQVSELKAAGASQKLIDALGRPRSPSGSAQPSGDITDFAILLDCSGSMMEHTPDGKPKMVVAKAVVADLVRKVPDGLRLSFIIYGHTKENPCEAVRVVREMSPIDADGKAELVRFIQGLKPVGGTPIAFALKTAEKELTRNDAACGLVLVSDGKESCKGDPAAEAAALARNEKLTFGINVIGFDVKADERVALEEIARAGRGRYLNAESATELTEAVAAVEAELKKNAKKAVAVDTTRRALRVLEPDLAEMPEIEEIQLVKAGDADVAVYSKVAEIPKYGEIRIPSATQKYDVLLVPKVGRAIFLMRDFSLPERKVVEVRPEELVGLIQVNGSGDSGDIDVLPAGASVRGVYRAIQRAEKYGEVMVVPAGTYDVYVDRDQIEADLEVKPGELHRLQ